MPARTTRSRTLRCSCDGRVRVLHFAGGVRTNPVLASINATVLRATGPQLSLLARERSRQPEVLQRGALPTAGTADLDAAVQPGDLSAPLTGKAAGRSDERQGQPPPLDADRRRDEL